MRDATPTMGYYAGLEYLNGFRKVIYWSKQKMLNHADRYSKAFNKNTYLRLLDGEVDPNDYSVSSYWYKDFDGMAMKTMLRQLISKWGVMSTEMQTAYQYDEGVPVMQGSEFVGVDYVDNDGVESNAAIKQAEQQMEAEEPSPMQPVQKAAPAPRPEPIVQQTPVAEPAVRRGRPPKRDEPVQPTLIPEESPMDDFPGGFPDDDPLL